MEATIQAIRPAVREVKRYGYIPDLPDNRDLVAKVRKTRAKLQSKVDLRLTGFMPEVYDQSALGSCTANGIAGIFEYEQRRQGLTDYMPSRLFIYYEERRIINAITYDSGAFIRDGLKVVNKLGAPHEDIWPYNINQFTWAPPQAAYDDGQNHQVIEYATVDNKLEYTVKEILAAGIPITFGFTVYPWFESPDSAGFVKPVANQQVLGGHCTDLVGYFTFKRIPYGIIRNSWGKNWADQGYCYMPLRWICNYWNADDFWVIKSVEGDAPPLFTTQKLKLAA